MLSVALLLIGVHLAFAGTHTYQYFYTATSGLPTFPEFVAVGMLNGKQINYYDSSTMEAVLKVDWLKSIVNTNELRDIWRGTQQWYKSNLPILKDRFNQSSDAGVHTFQMMYGCELEDDGTTQGYYQYGYDGGDFISFDKNTLTNTAANSQAVITKNKWDANRAQSENRKTYLENTCIEWLKKYVSYGKNSLERKVAPEVSLLQKSSSSPVICHATGFYPSNIMMTWKKNNDDHNEDVEVSETLQNADGTFQKSIILSVTSEEWKKNPDVYRCVIQHVGAEKENTVLLNENNIRSNRDSTNIIAIIVGCVVALAVVAAILGLVVWKVKSKGYKKASSQDSDSEHSDQPLPKA